MPWLDPDRLEKAQEFNEIVGKNIKRGRMSAGISTRQMAEDIDISRSQLNRIELGERAITFQQAIAVAEYLDIPVASLTIKPRRTSLVA